MRQILELAQGRQLGDDWIYEISYKMYMKTLGINNTDPYTQF
jgi:hypothetical protein